MVLSVEIAYCDDSYVSTDPTIHSDGGDKSESVRDFQWTCVTVSLPVVMSSNTLGDEADLPKI